MTVISMIPNDTPYLLSKVTEVPKDVLRSFPHSKKVGNYLLGNTLGEGSFAKVKEALHIPTGERVAIKIIDKKKSRDDSYVRRNLRREGKILQMVTHQNVVQLLEIMETQNSYYLVTELCKGGDLMDHISRKRKLPESEVKKYVRQIVSAVDYLHRSGILHRDLKIENLLLDEFRDIKIIDFGLSNCIKVVQTKEGSKAQEFCVTQCGSPAYAAPELLGRQKYGPKVDVWSIGVNMYAMLTGNLPFTVDPFNIKALHNKMINGQMNAMPEGASKECKDIIKKLLHPDPDRRISIEDTFKHPWIAEAPGLPMTRAPYPNKVKTETLDNHIVKHMSENQGFRTGEIIRFVTGNVPSSATAMYYLILRKLNRQYPNLKSPRKTLADQRKIQRGKQDQQISVTMGTVNNKNIPNSNTTISWKAALKTVPGKNIEKLSSMEKDDTEVRLFSDISKSPDGTRSPIKLRIDAQNGKSCQTQFPNVATKYVIPKRKPGTATTNTTKNGYRGENNAGIIPERNHTTLQTEVTEYPFRKRASTFPDKTHKMSITVNGVNKDEAAIGVVTKDKDAAHVIIYKGKGDSNNFKDSPPNSQRTVAQHNPENDLISSKPTSPQARTSSQYVVLSKKSRMTNRNLINVSNMVSSRETESSGASHNEDDFRSSPNPKQLLSRLSRINKIPRAKLTRNMVITETEQVSEISPTSTRTLCSRNTNVSSCLSRPSSAGLPGLHF